MAVCGRVPENSGWLRAAHAFRDSSIDCISNRFVLCLKRGKRKLIISGLEPAKPWRRVTKNTDLKFKIHFIKKKIQSTSLSLVLDAA
jgi:hypothetical protein